jgi:hypothetical protein
MKASTINHQPTTANYHAMTTRTLAVQNQGTLSDQ